jgi:hypothetical protein
MELLASLLREHVPHNLYSRLSKLVKTGIRPLHT